jgi:hypothetical protein
MKGCKQQKTGIQPACGTKNPRLYNPRERWTAIMRTVLADISSDGSHQPDEINSARATTI